MRISDWSSDVCSSDLCTLNPLKDFVIQFAGLKNGGHEFDFKVGDEFFDQFDYSIIKKGNLEVHMELDKRERMLVLDIAISGTVELVCDRCLDTFDYPLETRQQQKVKMTDKVETDDKAAIVSIGVKEKEKTTSPHINRFSQHKHTPTT